MEPCASPAGISSAMTVQAFPVLRAELPLPSGFGAAAEAHVPSEHSSLIRYAAYVVVMHTLEDSDAWGGRL
jgi:hypothetical protein